MKITNNYKNKLVRFDSLQAGDVFLYNDDTDVYMKIDAIADEYGNCYKAVCLTDGEAYGISNHELVHKVQCELIIE